MSDLKEALLYEKFSSGVAMCELCPRNCIIMPYRGDVCWESLSNLKKENLGFCGTRVNLKGKLYAINYGRVTSLDVDPIEKKPLFHFHPGNKVLSFGSFGCNLRCPNCHNWEISQTSSLINSCPASALSIVKNFSAIEANEIVNQALENNCFGISYTFNEPTVSLEFVLEVMRLAHKAKLKNIWVTNGFFSQKTRKIILPWIDAANVDLKSFNQKFYRSHCKGSLITILRNIEAMGNQGIHLEISTLLLSKLNNDFQNLFQLATFIVKRISPYTPWHLLNFSASVSWQMQDWPSIDDQEIKKAFKIGKEAGLKFIYARRLQALNQEAKQEQDSSQNISLDTFCSNCQALAVKRSEYAVERFDENGSCQKCGQKLFLDY